MARATNREIDRANDGAGTSDPPTEALNAPLRHDDVEPLHRQLEHRFRAAIADGRLRPGVRLASTRALARELGVARITVQVAYDQLVAEGYLQVDGRRGTQVARDLPERGFAHGPAVPDRDHAAPGRLPALNPWAADRPVTGAVTAVPAPIDLGPEWFGLDVLDRRAWERVLVDAWRELSSDGDSEAASYQGALGDARLRHALADHLAVRRAVRCRADQIAITAGSSAALSAVARTWLGPGRVCVVEDPGGGQLRRSLASSGAEIVPVPVDDGGMRVDQLPAQADVAFLTPSWQYPAGGSLSLRRRLALLRWAADVGALVVEDDCESELRYEGDPLPALQSLAPDGRVLYLSTFSKVLFPGLRTGYVVVPDRHRGPFLAALEAGARPAGALEQRALAMFLERGAFHRHVRRLRGAYAARRDAFAAGLSAEPGSLVIRRAEAGGHLIVGITDPAWTATALAAALAESGLRVEPLSANRLLATADDELVVYLSRPDATTLAAAGREIARVAAAGPPRRADETGRPARA